MGIAAPVWNMSRWASQPATAACSMFGRQRGEPRGVDYREDFPEASDNWLCRIVVANTGEE